MGYERKRGVKVDFEIFGMVNWAVDGITYWERYMVVIVEENMI